MQGHPLVGKLPNSLLNTTQCNRTIKTRREITIGTSQPAATRMRWLSQLNRKRQEDLISKIKTSTICSDSVHHNRRRQAISFQRSISNSKSRRIPLTLECSNLIATNQVKFQLSRSLLLNNSPSTSSVTLEMDKVRKLINLLSK